MRGIFQNDFYPINKEVDWKPHLKMRNHISLGLRFLRCTERYPNGNKLVLEDPVVLISALGAEGKSEKLSYLTAPMWFGVECSDPKCVSDRNAFYQTKIDALEKAKVPKKHKDCRRRLIAVAKS